MFCRGFLLGQFHLEVALARLGVAPQLAGIDERIRPSCLGARGLAVGVVESGMAGRNTSAFSAFITAKLWRKSETILGYSVLPTREFPPVVVLQANTTSCRTPFSVTGMVQVVQPGVWPGVRCAVSVTPPSLSLSPSRTARSTCTGVEWIGALGPK